MLAYTLVMLATTALTFVVDPSHCRQVSTGRTGGASWQTDGKGHLSISVDARSVGDVSLQCSVRVPPGAKSVTFTFGQVLMSFQPATSKVAGSGLLIAVGPACKASVTRVAGEDWVKSRSRQWTAAVPDGARSILLKVTLHDISSTDPMRVDLTAPQLEFGTADPDCI